MVSLRVSRMASDSHYKTRPEEIYKYMKPLSAAAAILTCLGLAPLQGVQAAGADYALQLPGAEHSMLLDIAAAGERLVAVGERGHILVSEERGESWRQVEVPTTAMLTRVFFFDETLGWAVGHDGKRDARAQRVIRAVDVRRDLIPQLRLRIVKRSELVVVKGLQAEQRVVHPRDVKGVPPRDTKRVLFTEQDKV